MILFGGAFYNDVTVKACRELSGESDAVVEFEYDGVFHLTLCQGLCRAFLLLLRIRFASMSLIRREMWPAHFLCLRRYPHN